MILTYRSEELKHADGGLGIKCLYLRLQIPLVKDPCSFIKHLINDLLSLEKRPGLGHILRLCLVLRVVLDQRKVGSFVVDG